MMKQHGNKLMQKWKNKAGVRLSALDKKKLVLTNLPYVLTAFYADRASCLYRRSPGEDIGNKLLYAMEHADRIFTGILLSFDLRDLLVGVEGLDQMKCQVITFVHSILFCHFSCHRKLKICSFRGTAKTGN